MVSCGIDGDPEGCLRVVVRRGVWLEGVERGVLFDGVDVLFEEEVGGEVFTDDVDGGSGLVEEGIWVVLGVGRGVVGESEGERSLGDGEEDDGGGTEAEVHAGEDDGVVERRRVGGDVEVGVELGEDGE